MTMDNPITTLSILYTADVIFGVCKERTSEFDDLVPKLQHQEHVLEGTLTGLGSYHRTRSPRSGPASV